MHLDEGLFGVGSLLSAGLRALAEVLFSDSALVSRSGLIFLVRLEVGGGAGLATARFKTGAIDLRRDETVSLV